ncbi:Transposase and inactivated derivatives%2C TnpA family [Escherichia coli]|nr:Transposase and inactivated derivatives%2C TnpA family [Escherichia coli]CTZ87494.1 Transposase and inactivated derivatives%2C TnpA family [Escherichia coli]CTZ88630.1 Transposase and inactivated derivatives%2C TnpA family [Escherichia coli]
MLETTYEQYLRLASLVTTNDCITDAIEALPIFPHYSFDPETLYGAVDGQKFGVERPTLKARHSRKYFGRGKGMVAYTLLCNHIPINGYLIGTNDYEAHHVFDIWYRNTSKVKPTAITGDMHSINKANFAILHWFGLRFESHFTDLNRQLQELYYIRDPSAYTAILSRLLERLEAEGNAKGIEALARISPVAWQHILLNGHYTFQSSNEIIDLDELVAGLKLG